MCASRGLRSTAPESFESCNLRPQNECNAAVHCFVYPRGRDTNDGPRKARWPDCSGALIERAMLLPGWLPVRLQARHRIEAQVMPERGAASRERRRNHEGDFEFR